MPVPLLGALCRAILVANIDMLTYVSDMPYEKVQDILAHVRYEDQLREIERNSPQVQFTNDELWAALAHKKFPVQLKKLRKLNNNQPPEVGSWKDLFEQLHKEDEAKEAEALRHLEKTLTNLNKNKDGNKTALADPRGLPKRPRDTAYTTSHSGSDRHFSPPKDTPMQKVRKAAGQVVNSRQLAIKARHTPQQALSTVPKGLSEAMRIRRQPMIPMRSDKRPENADPERTEREHHGRRTREAKLLAAQKPKAPAKGDDTHMPGTNTPNSLQTALEASRKPATAATPSAPLRAASPPNLASGLVKTSSNNILSRPPGVRKAHSRFKVVTSPAPPSVSSSNSPNDLNATPTSSRRLSVPAWSPSAATSLDTDSEDDECREKETPTKPMQLAPGSPTKRPFSMMEGESSESASSTALVSSTGLPPRKRIKKVPGIFMPAKRAR